MVSGDSGVVIFSMITIFGVSLTASSETPRLSWCFDELHVVLFIGVQQVDAFTWLGVGGGHLVLWIGLGGCSMLRIVVDAMCYFKYLLFICRVLGRAGSE